MGKFYGKIGYAVSGETAPGVWEETIIEYNYAGDIVRNSRRWQSGPNVNDDLVINNTISVISDPFADLNFQTMRYIKWMGANWKITNVEVQRPRLVLTIGGIYNGITP